MNIEFLGCILLIVLSITITVLLIMSCFAYRKDIKDKLEKEKSVEISLSDVIDFVKGIDKVENKSLDELFLQWLDETDKPNLFETSSEFVNVDKGDCIGYECSCSPQREDCCKSIDSKKCVLKININKLCGIKEYIKNPKLVTRDEAEMLTKALTEYYSNKN